MIKKHNKMDIDKNNLNKTNKDPLKLQEYSKIHH